MAGIMPGTKFRTHTAELRPGDGYVFFTDGVSEAFNDAGELFGEGRLLEHLRHSPGETVADTVAGVLQAVRTHAGGHPQSDDITIVAVRRAP
jgi:sigma-B regulation protein RsbU (phosphoserine phosphatase)